MLESVPVAMTAVTVLLVAVALAAVLVADVVAGAAERARARRVARLEPVLDDIADGVPVAAPSNERDADALGGMVVSLAAHVRGVEREQLRRWLREHGFEDRARRLLASPLPSRRARGIALATITAEEGGRAQIVGMLDDPNLRVRATAARSLGAVGLPSDLPALFEAVAGARVAAGVGAMAAQRIFPRTVDELRVGLAHQDPSVRRITIEVAGTLGLVDARADGERMLQDDDRAVRSAARGTLARLDDPLSIPALAHALASASEDEAAEIAEVIRRIRGVRSSA